MQARTIHGRYLSGIEALYGEVGVMPVLVELGSRFNVKNYGATGNGTTDDTAAIVSTMNAAGAAGGGVVYFPAGTYLISFAGAGQPTTGSMITVPSNIAFVGASQSSTTILMAPSQGDYRYIFDCQVDDSSNVIFQDLTIDQNGLNAGGSVPGKLGSLNSRAVIIFTNGTGEIVQRCHFTNIVGASTIAAFGGLVEVPPGITSSVTIQNNTFDNVGLNTTDQAYIYDESTIYVDIANVTITGNTFTGRLVNGTTIGAMGATTAIEIHGPDQNITNNTISNYSGGINVASSANGYANNNQFYQNNTFTNVGNAFCLWPDGTLSSCSILNNNITIDVLDYENYLGNKICGIYENPDGIGPINGMLIENNSITFTNYSTATPASSLDVYNGIAIDTRGSSAVNADLTITGNIINNPPQKGIYINAVTTGLTVTGNTITNPGSS